MIVLEGTRFGTIDVDEQAVIELPAGLVGFPSETRFVLLRGEGDGIGHLQSLRTPHLALAVIDGALVGADYPVPSAAALASEAGLGGADVAVLVPVVARRGEPDLRANLLAPIIVDATARRAAQVVLDPRRYTTAAPLPARRSPAA